MYLVRRAEWPAGEFQWKKKRGYLTNEDNDIGMYFNKIQRFEIFELLLLKIIECNRSHLFKILIDTIIGYYENRKGQSKIQPFDGNNTK